MKSCRICKEVKPLDKFYRNGHQPDGRREICAVCGAKEMAEYRKNNYSLVYANKFKTTVGHINSLLKITKCQICNGTNNIKRLAIDHNHTTGKIRGMLCDSCNHAIGKFKENIEVMQKAITYLKEHHG